MKETEWSRARAGERGRLGKSSTWCPVGSRQYFMSVRCSIGGRYEYLFMRISMDEHLFLMITNDSENSLISLYMPGQFIIVHF